jgi:hypothetical protein
MPVDLRYYNVVYFRGVCGASVRETGFGSRGASVNGSSAGIGVTGADVNNRRASIIYKITNRTNLYPTVPARIHCLRTSLNPIATSVSRSGTSVHLSGARIHGTDIYDDCLSLILSQVMGRRHVLKYFMEYSPDIHAYCQENNKKKNRNYPCQLEKRYFLVINHMSYKPDIDY